MKLSKVIALLCAAVLLGCAAADRKPAPASEELVGSYHGYIDSFVAFLELKPDGEYECFVSPGMVDGCLNVVGSGVLMGSWDLADGSISFAPRPEPSDVDLSFQGATAVVSGEGILLTIAGGECLPADLERIEPYPELAPTDETSSLRR